MTSSGKHLAKNNKNTKGGAIILVGTILVTSLLARLAIKADTKMEMPLNNSHTISNNEQGMSLDSVLNHIKYNYATVDKYGMTETGLIFEYFQSQIRGLSPEEQQAKLLELINDERLFYNVYEYVLSYRNTPIHEFEMVDVNLDNYQAIINNEEVMGLVNKYCAAYKISPEVIVALLAENSVDGKVDRNNPFGLNSSWLGGITSSRSAWNYDTNSKDDLMKMQSSASSSFESAIRYGIMCYAGSAKEANGITDDTIRIFYAGVNTRISNNNPAIEQFKNEVLSYIAKAGGTDRIDLNYIFTLSESFQREMHEVYGHQLTQDEIIDIVNDICNELAPHLQVSNGKRM